MAGQIRLDIQVAEIQARAIQNNQNNMLNLIRSMDNVINTLRANGWEGEAAQGFEDRWNNDIKNKCLNQAVELFEEMHHNLTLYKEEMQRIDRETGSKLKGTQG